MGLKCAVQAKVGTAVLKLPSRALRKMAGEPVVVDGRTLDVRLQLAAAQSAEGPSITELDPIAARSGAAEAFAQTCPSIKIVHEFAPDIVSPMRGILAGG